MRIIDIKTIYETYMVYKRKDSILALDLLKTIEKNVSLNEYSKIKIKLNFKIIIIILSLSLILFFAGSTISYFQYGKIVYKIVPYEYKEVLTMEYMVEQFLSQLEKDSDQYKYLNKLYEQIKVAYSKGGINQKEYLEKLNQILAKSTSLSDNTGLQKAGTSSISNKGEQLDAQDVIKNEKKQYSNYDNLAKKYIKEKEEDEKITKESSKVELLDDKANQNFFEFLKNELFHPDTAKEKGLAGYQSQNIKSSDKYSVDYSLLLQSIYSNSKDFSYSLSNQLSESKKIEIFNYLVKQYNFSNKDITYDEELFYKLIILYFDQLKKYGF